MSSEQYTDNLDAFFTSHYARCVSYAQRLTGRLHDAEDVVSVALHETLNRDYLSKEERLKDTFLRIRSRSYDLLRDRIRRDKCLDELACLLRTNRTEPVHSYVSATESTAYSREIVTIVRAYIKTVSDKRDRAILRDTLLRWESPKKLVKKYGVGDRRIRMIRRRHLEILMEKHLRDYLDRS